MGIESTTQESHQHEERKGMLFAKDVLRNYVQVSSSCVSHLFATEQHRYAFHTEPCSDAKCLQLHL